MSPEKLQEPLLITCWTNCAASFGPKLDLKLDKNRNRNGTENGSTKKSRKLGLETKVLQGAGSGAGANPVTEIKGRDIRDRECKGDGGGAKDGETGGGLVLKAMGSDKVLSGMITAVSHRRIAVVLLSLCLVFCCFSVSFFHLLLDNRRF
jgi:hypothetical protein